jgi:hypothetical protein
LDNVFFVGIHISNYGGSYGTQKYPLSTWVGQFYPKTHLHPHLTLIFNQKDGFAIYIEILIHVSHVCSGHQCW